MQRTGTTSVGQFFSDFGFKCAGWPACRRNNWRERWYERDFDSIFRSKEFRSADAYEDSPWFYPGFYRVLYHRFPNSMFVLFERDPDEWWESMVNHSGGEIPGLNRIHSKIYRREMEFFELMYKGDITDKMWDSIHDEKRMSLSDNSEHYKNIYEMHNLEVKDFFHKRAPKSLHVGRLDDPKKWKKLGKFLGVQVPDEYRCHKNRSMS